MSNLFNKVIHDRQFNFQPFEISGETGYHVDVKDEQGTRWEFRMVRNTNNEWEIRGEKLPAWIRDSGADLERAIREHE